MRNLRLPKRDPSLALRMTGCVAPSFFHIEWRCGMDELRMTGCMAPSFFHIGLGDALARGAAVARQGVVEVNTAGFYPRARTPADGRGPGYGVPGLTAQAMVDKITQLWYSQCPP